MTVASDTRLWGSFAWRFLHAISFTYPSNPTDKDKETYKAFFELLPEVLPCKICGHHFKHFLTNNPIQLNNQAELSRWVYEAHSNVNKMQNKPNPSYETVKEAYTRSPDLLFFQMPEQLQAEYMRNEHVDGYINPESNVANTPTFTVTLVVIIAVVLLLLIILGVVVVNLMRKKS